jgi:hypothetical protein
LGNNSWQRDCAKQLAERTGYKIVSLLHLDEYIASDKSCADFAPYDFTPVDFLAYIKNAEFICTDSFHCTVFSILFEKDFYTFRRYANNHAQSTNSRLDSLLSILDLKGRIIERNGFVTGDYLKNIDWQVIIHRNVQPEANTDDND